MKCYSYDQNGFFTYEENAQPSPLEPGVFLLPAMATFIAPPTADENTIQKFTGDAWILVSLDSISSDGRIIPDEPTITPGHRNVFDEQLWQWLVIPNEEIIDEMPTDSDIFYTKTLNEPVIDENNVPHRTWSVEQKTVEQIKPNLTYLANESFKEYCQGVIDPYVMKATIEGTAIDQSIVTTRLNKKFALKRYEEQVELASDHAQLVSIGLFDVFTASVDETDAEYVQALLLSKDVTIGRQVRLDSFKCIEAVTGWNIRGSLTIEQIDQMEIDFAPIMLALSNGRPWKAKPMIQAVNNVLYNDLRDTLLSILSNY